MKKALAVLLCAVLLLGAMPFVSAAEYREREPFSLAEVVMQEAHDSYYRSRATSGKRSFHGKCGALVGHQLYNLGINKQCLVFNGNDSYDYYASREATTGGYYITPYSAAGYSLLEALMAVSQNGTRDVKNILVGFQWTNTEAGNKYGHVMLINGIVGGKVYFVESFDCSLGGAEGTVISCSMEEFAKYYNRWTLFEGLIHFGMGSYHDVCPYSTTDLTVQTRFSTVLRSEPAVVGQQGCVRLRDVAAGERFRATAIYESERTLYYRVETNEGFAFLPAGAAALLQVNTEGLLLTDFSLPRQIQPGEVPALSGIVTDPYGELVSVEVCVTDEQEQLVRREVMDISDNIAQVDSMRDDLYFDLLEPGVYCVELYASRACAVVAGNDTATYYARTLLGRRRLQVGGNPRDARQALQSPAVSRDGWFREDGKWYCYENGKPCTGWVTRFGVHYYLQNDGSAVTGAQTVEGKPLYFSAGGALVTGWLTLEGKTGYRAADGTAVTGWQALEGKLYCFGEDGVMLTDTEQVRDGVTYRIAKDGTATAEKQEAQNG